VELVELQVNNAGVGHLGPFNKELAIRDVKVNYGGTKNVTETLLPLLKHSDAGARIVILSSLHGRLSVSISMDLDVGSRISMILVIVET